ncbi:pro-sigmaK processing inhibitor BofA family protein [Paenibacillus sp. TAB 01]|uniref:pro-sigmaK processing inhibitor BofA family protein n=1 Tax=Paenibacillus sp. TAB 01 TaxID=3368988 RepID=UPI0037502CB4
MLKSYILWGVLGFSTLLLIITLLRHRFAFQWMGYWCLNVAFAAFLLYLLNLFVPYTHVEVPLNATTVGTVSILGIPGLVMLAALKLWVI